MRVKPIERQELSVNIVDDINRLVFFMKDLIRKKELFIEMMTQQILLGKVRLPGFSKTWKREKISDICKFEPNKNFFEEQKGKDALRFGLIKPLSQEVATNNQDVMDVPYVDANDFFRFDDQIVLFSNKGIYGPWLQHLLNFLKKELCKKNHEILFISLLLEKPLDFIIQVPSCLEQKAIIEVLTDMNTEIRQLKKKLEKYQKIQLGIQHCLD